MATIKCKIWRSRVKGRLLLIPGEGIISVAAEARFESPIVGTIVYRT